MAADSPVVLIVEDERNLADLYAQWLADDFAVRTLYDGEAALAEIDRSVGVVLLDRRMPGLSGDEVLERIREQGLDCRVAIVSAVEPDFDVLGMGFDDYVSKPVSREDLQETVDRLLDLSRYDRTVGEFYALVSKKAAIEAQKSQFELRSSDEYAALEAEIEAVRDRLDAEAESLADGAFDALFDE